MPIPSLRRRVYGYRGLERRTKISRANKKKKVGWRKLVMFLLSTAVFGFLILTIMVAWASKDLPDPDKLTDRNVAQSTKIYDRTGSRLLYEIFSDKKRTLVELNQIPKNLINGTVATEDSKFYEHKGVRPLSFVRAIAYRLIGRSNRLGATSTLTQQLVKNAILTSERSLNRKIKEILLAIRLEQKYSKEQILKIYFNEIPYGSTNYGAEAAAQAYFNKHVWELNLTECAALAGMPKAPTKYLNNPEAMGQRRDFVLKRMLEEGYIAENEYKNALAEPIKIERRLGEIKAPHFVLYVKEQMVSRYGEQMVDTGGLRVITTLDWEKQEIAEKAIKDFEKTLAEAQADNTALVALDPKTGQILSMVGSRDFNNEEIDGQFNVATQGRRQPGSSFKPIVYAAAFEKGYTPDTVLFDVKTNFAVSGKPYEPLNYDLQERGPVTMRQALQGSLNIPAVQTLYLVGAQKGVEFARRLGYTTLNEGEFGLSLVLGGGEVKLLEHTNAYAVFANNGVYMEPTSILRVEDKDNSVLYEWKRDKGQKVLDESIATMVSNVLSDDASRAYIFGANGVLTLPNRQVAAKTGTTNNYRDAWTVGYTPSLAAGVWVGNTNNKEMRKGDGGSKLAAPIWNAFMRESLAEMPVEYFLEPPPNSAEKPILRGSTGGGVTLAIDKMTNKIATSSTPPEYIEHRTYVPAHPILHYVNKDDPRGPMPDNPADDPQYQIWENAIQSWVTRKKEKEPDWHIEFSEPPTEYDDIHSLNLLPSLEIVYPAQNSTLASRQIDTDIRTSAPRGIKKVTYKIDDKYVGVISQHPFNFNQYVKWLEAGEHLLTAIAEDDVGNKTEKQVSFTLFTAPEPPGVSWSYKTLTLKQDDFPRIIILSSFKLEEIKEVVIHLQKDGGAKQLLSAIAEPFKSINGQIGFDWKSAPDVGNYVLTAELKLKNGSVIEGEEMMVIVN